MWKVKSMTDDILTIEEVAKYLRVSERTVYDWAQKGEIPAGKIGTVWRFKKSEVENWVNQKLTSDPLKSTDTQIQVKNILSPERVIFINHSSKHDALVELSEVLATAPQVKNKSELTSEILKREELMSTAVGRGIAIPHVRLSSITDLVMAVGICKKPVEDFQTLKYYAYENEYVETKRHDWWKKLGIRFRSKNYTQTLAEPIFDYAMEYVQFLPEYKYTVDDPINSNEAYDAFMWAFKKENWANPATPATEIADEDLPLALRPSTTVEDFVYRFAEYEDDMPRLFVDNSTTYFIEKKNLNALPIQIMSTAGLLTAYTSGVKHKDYTERVYKNALQIIPVAPTGTGKSTCTENFEIGFGKTMFEEFAFYKTYEEKNDETTNSCVVIGNGTAAKAKKGTPKIDLSSGDAHAYIT